MFCINTTWHLITHCEMDDLFFWAYWKTGMRLCCQKFKWRRKFKNNTYPFLLVMLMPFPVRWLGGYLDLKIISKTEPCFPALQDLMYVDETASMPHKAIFYNHTKFSSGVYENISGQFSPIKKKKEKKEKKRQGGSHFVFQYHLSDCMSWFYLPWSEMSLLPLSFSLQIRTVWQMDL